MEGYNLTADVYKEAKKYKMADVRYLIYANLRGAGMSVRNSWFIAFNGTGANWSKETLEREMNKLESLESVQRRIAEIQGLGVTSSSGRGLTPEELAKATSKEKILEDLVIAQRKQKQGSPEWQKTTALLADIARVKQDDIQTEDTTIHSFLPARYPTSCQNCLLFKNGTAELLKNKQKG